uniref:Evasin n=1 Tax=Rhipicephalus pulchellus TaxID=72859 RepID=L7LZS0_RHIPC
MVRLLSWAVFFAIIACSLGQVAISTGFASCIQIIWETTAGGMITDCSQLCDGKLPETGTQCLALGSGATRHYGKQDVNYTCILGQCDQEEKVCKTDDLLIDCWAPKVNQKIRNA